MQIPTFHPKCPVCGEKLEGVGFPLPAKGKGMCPAGMVSFEFEAETDSTKLMKDKNGRMTKKVYWVIKGPKSQHANN